MVLGVDTLTYRNRTALDSSRIRLVMNGGYDLRLSGQDRAAPAARIGRHAQFESKAERIGDLPITVSGVDFDEPASSLGCPVARPRRDPVALHRRDPVACHRDDAVALHRHEVLPRRHRFGVPRRSIPRAAARVRLERFSTATSHSFASRVHAALFSGRAPRSTRGAHSKAFIARG